MGKVKDELLFTLIRNYLVVYLPVHRQASEHTVRAYRTAWNQLLRYTAEKRNIRVMSVTMEMLDYDTITSYLEWLTEEKKVSVSTRNLRLAAIRAFFSYASACKPEYIDRVSELSVIKTARGDRFAAVDYMTEDAVKALLDTPDISTRIGIRDRFFMAFLYDTGSRVQEVLNVKICDLKIDKTATVTLRGKGHKVRIVPLMQNTVGLLEQYMKVFHPEETWQSPEYLFYITRNGIRNQMNDDTIRIRFQKYVSKAKEKCSSVPDNIHPHLWRHTRAMHLYQHGMDLTLISQWLGHSNLETTLIYAHADTEHKRKAIEKAMNTGKPADEPFEPYTVSDEEILHKLYGL